MNSRADGAVDKSHVSLVDSTSEEVDRVAMEEEDIHEIGEEEKERLNDLDYLTGNPLPIDILSYAVPVCGPYSAVQSYKYRVKVIPGTVKKGKGIFSFFSYLSQSLGSYCSCYACPRLGGSGVNFACAFPSPCAICIVCGFCILFV